MASCCGRGSCCLYLAPSSLPGGAGLGVYTAADVPAESRIGGGGANGGLDDLVVPLADRYKTLPHRGQQRFLSWLGYIWPAYPDALYPWGPEGEGSSPRVPFPFHRLDDGLSAADGLSFLLEDGTPADAFAPGLASTANSHPEYANIGVSENGFVSTEDIPAGSELFLDYGEKWHERRERKRLARERDGDRGDKWDARDGRASETRPERLPTEEEKRRRWLAAERTDEPAYTRVTETPAEDERPRRGAEGTEEEEEEEEAGGESVPPVDLGWLAEHGACVDNLRAGPSSTRGGEAGRGAFARNFLPAGSVVSPAPLLALKRDDLNIYAADERAEDPGEALDLSRVVGRELLLNYCYGRRDSELLLLPYAPAVNLINHDGEGPNAAIRWPSGGTLGFDSGEWLSEHPLDVQDMSGRLLMEFVALRDIAEGEEVRIDYGRAWEEARAKHRESDSAEGEFRHERGVPEDFFPDGWMRKSMTYEIAPPDPNLKAGEHESMRWAHNGEVVARHLYRVKLPTGLSASLRDYSDRMGITLLVRDLLGEHQDLLESDEWEVFETRGEEWYAHRMSKDWKFNMHYIAPWDDTARRNFLAAFGAAGFGAALEGMGDRLGLDNVTCYHVSHMGVSKAGSSDFTHIDIYNTRGKALNYLFPVKLVDGSPPELDVQSDDYNIVVSVNYEYDVAYAVGDWVYHKTRSVEYDGTDDFRIALSAYCSQIDGSTAEMNAVILDGEDPSPFMDQFEQPTREIHWSRERGSQLDQLGTVANK